MGLKILYHHRIASFDGQAVHIQGLVEALRAAGCVVVMVGPPVLHELKTGRSFNTVGRLKSWLPRALYELLEAAYAVPSYLRLLWAWFRTRPDLLYERYNLFQPAGAWLKRTVGIPMLLEVNSPLLRERGAEGGVALQGLAAWSERYVIATADKVLAVSQVLADMLRADGAAKDRLLAVPNGAPPAYLAAASDEPARKSALGLEDCAIIGFVGFPREWHRLERIIDLIARNGSDRKLHFLVVGDGPGVAALHRRANELGVGHCLTVTGAVPHDQVVDYIRAFDVAVQPGVTAYASPLKIPEYMALGRAIVAPDTANIREMLVDQASALLFDPEDPQSLDAAVLKLCEDAELRRQLGGNARRRLLEQGYTWEANADRVIALAHDLSVRAGSGRHTA